MPGQAQTGRFATDYPDGMLLPFPKDKGSIARDFKWLGSYRYGIVHLGGRDAGDLRRRADAASALLGWPSPYLNAPVVDAAMAHAATDPNAMPANLSPGLLNSLETENHDNIADQKHTRSNPRPGVPHSEPGRLRRHDGPKPVFDAQTRERSV